jgi:N-terminal domain of galactosyltransferase
LRALRTMPPVHLIIPTHTTRHLRTTLLGVSLQTRRPDSLTVTCDNDDPEIARLLEASAREFSLAITLVRRAHQGTERLAQVRNNAVRELLRSSPPRDLRLVFLDGDCYLTRGALALHEALAAKGDLVIPFRVNLTQTQTDAFDESAAKAGRDPVQATQAQLAELRIRDRLYRRQRLLRRLGLAKGHKPKPLGGHHSVSLRHYVLVNGHDEQYHTWGTEDDDFGRRVYLAGGRPVVAVARIIAFHLYHPTRAPRNWHDRENAERFALAAASKTTPRCEFGLETPLPQAAVEVIRFGVGEARLLHGHMRPQ